MKKPTQRDTNPYPYSDSNKRYLTFDYYMRRRFGSKCARISLDAGFSCPNIDGRRGTRLEEMWRRGEYVPMDMEEYAKTVVRQLEVLRGDTVIARVGGDAPNDVLLAPDWCRRKTAVSNLIDRMLYENGTYEGRLYNKHG